MGTVILVPSRRIKSKIFFGYYDWQMPLYFRIFIPSSIFGIILGIIARKLLPEDKKLGIIGIVLSFLSLLIWLVIWFWIVGWSTA